MTTLRETVRKYLEKDLSADNETLIEKMRKNGVLTEKHVLRQALNRERHIMKKNRSRATLPADPPPAAPKPVVPAASALAAPAPAVPKLTEGMVGMISATIQVAEAVGGTDNVRQVLSLVSQAQQLGVTSPEGVIAVLDKTLELVDALSPKPPATP